MLCPSVHVKVRNKLTGQTVDTYMDIDNFSTACYVDRSLVGGLGYESTPAQIEVTTIENKSSRIPVDIVENF